ncbi:MULTISPECIES: 2-hydroxycarboxylate transporter family protein [Shouchella]|uniref:2-hydroxycarboxylate transporter family protein n=1 Tax=Shouchella lehensis TaxID=300825 RepID=A0A4Y7WFH7_9BACI|nr:2-hydroxycarboxylate transporter family protein [Shouchella lehensis]TES46705.1 2-hydroxycarboxylate transporter family protein [Shouchella lehensis]
MKQEVFSLEQLKTVTSDSHHTNDSKSQRWNPIHWKIGVLPVPIYVAVATIVLLAAYFQKLPADMIGGFAIIMVVGMLLGEIGSRIPIFRSIGGPAILALFVPSAFMFFNLLNETTVNAVSNLMTTSNFLYFYIACLVAGSILGMNRTVLMQGITKMLVPLVLGTVTAVAAGVGVGMLFGYEAKHTLFFIVVPILAGGIGEGILPLSAGYSAILGTPVADLISQMIPAAIIGNIFAIICAALLKQLGLRKQHLTGNGVLVKTKGDRIPTSVDDNKPVNFSLMGAGLLVACSFYVFGHLMESSLHIPAAILMILIAAFCKIFKLIPSQLEQGAFHLYKFVSTSFTWPLMVGLGLLFIPLEDVAGIISVSYVLICASVVVTMVTTGYIVGKWMNMHPVDSAIVTGCHSGLGGTGDVAILSASDRMSLMPFAQVATRLGGAGTVILATFILRWLGL